MVELLCLVFTQLGKWPALAFMGQIAWPATLYWKGWFMAWVLLKCLHTLNCRLYPGMPGGKVSRYFLIIAIKKPDTLTGRHPVVWMCLILRSQRYDVNYAGLCGSTSPCAGIRMGC